MCWCVCLNSYVLRVVELHPPSARWLEGELCVSVLLDWSLPCPALSPQMEQKRVSTTLLVLDSLLIQL